MCSIQATRDASIILSSDFNIDERNSRLFFRTRSVIQDFENGFTNNVREGEIIELHNSLTYNNVREGIPR